MRRATLISSSLVAVATVFAACSASRPGFEVVPTGTLVEDSGGPLEGGDCPLQCSADLRSIVRSCDGSVIETCAPNLACGEGGCIDPCASAAQAQGSLGCEFFMQPPPTVAGAGMVDNTGNCYAAYVVNAQPTAADLRIEYHGEAVDLSGAVFTFASGTGALTPHEGALQPGEGIVVFLVDSTSEAAGGTVPISCPQKALTADWPNPTTMGIGIGASFRLITTVPVAASTIYPFGGARSYLPSATLLLPVAGWGKQHVLVSAWERTDQIAGNSGVPGVQIVAAEDDTELTIRAAVDIQRGTGVGGIPRGSLKTFTLSRGQSLQIMQRADPSGSVIESNKPTSVFGGHTAMDIPSDCCCADTAQQQLPAVEQWGREYVVVGHRPRNGVDVERSPFRIVAAFNGTELFYDPAPPGNAPRKMAAGEVAMFSWSTEPFILRTQDAEHPVYVAQYMTGGSAAGGMGDAEFVNVVPAGQYLSSYAFYADPTYAETSLVVVRERQGGEFKDVWLECAGGSIPDFRPVGTEGKFEYARVDLTRGGQPVTVMPGGPSCGYGLQQLRSDGPFATTLWGWDVTASYAYPGGMGQRKLVAGRLVVN